MVLEEEPERSSSNSLSSKSSSPSSLSEGSGGGGPGGVQTKPNLMSVPGMNFSTLARYSGLSSLEQLNTIRARLEKLLP